MPHDDEKEEKEAADFCAQIQLSRRSVVAMDPGTPPSAFDSEEPATMAKLSTSTSLPTRLVLKKVPAASDDSSRDEHASFLLPQKRKRRLHHFCYSSSDEEQTVFKGTRRKAWIDCQDSDNESETGSSSHHKICDEKEDLPLGVIQARAGSSGCQLVMAKYRPEAGRVPSLDEAPVFHPTEEEFQNTLKYIESIRHIAEPYGICRVVPPNSWHPPCALKDNAEENLRFSTRVQKIHKLQVREPTIKVCPNDEHVPKKRGRPRASKILKFSSDGSNASQQEYFGFEPGPTFTIKEFEGYAKELKEKYFRSEDAPSDVMNHQGKQIEPSVETIEGEFWRIVEKPTEQIEVLYGADIETNTFKSGFPKAKPECERVSSAYERSGWNLNNIARLKDSVLEFEEGEISGVVVPWLYVGMCFSSFCWHVEDHHLYSVNYMHWGSPKIWYGVAGSAATKLENAMKKRLPELFNEQPDLLHKLVTQLSPSILKEEGVPAYRVVQNAGEVVITFPRAYHAGFNCGFNCAEAVNVAPVDWLPHGQSAVELYKQQHRKTSISHDKLLLLAVKQAIKAVNCKLEGSSESSSHRQILAKALKVRLDMEYSRRASLNGLKTRRMDINFDASEERECCVCSYDLHLSAVGCDCYPERYSCLEHARNLCGCSWGKKVAMYRYDLGELDEYLRVLQGHQGAMKLKIHGPKLQQQPDLQVETLESRMLKSYYASLNVANCGDMDSAITRDNMSISASNQVLIPRFPSGNALMESRSGPRVAKVVRPNKASSYDVELVHVGRLVMKSGWHNKNAILPAGFKSRVKFYNYLDLPQSCYYVSEILDCTDGKPLYKVSMEHRPSEKFVCSSLDLCWQSIQERVNSEIKRLRQMGRTNLPPLKPPESLKGFDMFGFNMPSIVQDVEALDPMHTCADYWKERLHEPLAVSDNGLNHGLSESLFGMGDNEHRYTSLKGFLSKAGKNQLSELQQILNSKWAADSWFRT